MFLALYLCLLQPPRTRRAVGRLCAAALVCTIMLPVCCSPCVFMQDLHKWGGGGKKHEDLSPWFETCHPLVSLLPLALKAQSPGDSGWH